MDSPLPASAIDGRAHYLSLLHADVAAGRDAQGQSRPARQKATRSQRMARHPGADRVVSADHDVLATYEQQGNTIALWADEHTDRTIDLIVWHGEIPVTWFQAFNLS